MEAVIGMLEEPDNLAPLAELISRFTQRFTELPNDVHDSVAIKGVRCCQKASGVLHRQAPSRCATTQLSGCGDCCACTGVD